MFVGFDDRRLLIEQCGETKCGELVADIDYIDVDQLSHQPGYDFTNSAIP
ncbi:MAG: hypothetical protein KJ606_05245 [Chloroflexi bacterium]|nr:hypothetical protein [Chloroflexota bacterium]